MKSIIVLKAGKNFDW